MNKIVNIPLFFTYRTEKFFAIKNKRRFLYGIIWRLVQVGILLYIGVVSLWYNRGYQKTEVGVSAVAAKVKGFIYTNFSADKFDPLVPNPRIYQGTWDVADLIEPPMENGAFFIATNVIITPNQEQGKCPENPLADGARCVHHCPVGVSLMTGPTTGRCVRSDVNSSIKVCEIEGWCPVEVKAGPLKNHQPLLAGTEDLTVLIKNFIEFENFDLKKRNIIQTSENFTYCRYHPEHDPLCPIFRLGTIIENLEGRKPHDTYYEMAKEGAVISIQIIWDCSLDSWTYSCYPQYSFRRLDSADSAIAPGWSFRYADYYGPKRSLYRVNGIYFIIQVQATAGKFSFLKLSHKLGSGLGLLVLAKLITYVFVMNPICGVDAKLYAKYEVDLIEEKTSSEIVHRVEDKKNWDETEAF